MSDKSTGKPEFSNEELLFREIGLIDDRFVAEADAYTARKRSSRQEMFVVLIAAILVFTLLTVLAVSSFRRIMSPEDNSDVLPPLAQVLLDRRENSPGAVPLSDINLFSDVVTVYWSYTDDPENVRALPLTESQADQLRSHLKNLHTLRVDRDAPDTGVRIWICDGNGMVITPCLSLTNGNIGFGTLFDYNPECQPDAAFAAYLTTLIDGTGT